MKNDRKAAIAAYKERKDDVGVFAIRCRETGEIWVGGTPNLDTVQNRIWFSLRFGNYPFPGLQAAWNNHGGDSMEFEILERLETEDKGYLRNRQIAELASSWRERLGAQAI